MKKLTLERFEKIYKEADLIWQDDKDKNIFYFAKERDFHIYYPRKKNGDYDMRYSICKRDKNLKII